VTEPGRKVRLEREASRRDATRARFRQGRCRSRREPGRFGVVALRRHVADGVLALALVLELDVVAPAAVLAVFEVPRPDELWRGAGRLERSVRLGRGIAEPVRDHRADEQSGDEAHDGDPGDDDGVLADRLSGFPRVSPPSHSTSVWPQAAGRQTARLPIVARAWTPPSRSRQTWPRTAGSRRRRSRRRSRR